MPDRTRTTSFTRRSLAKGVAWSVPTAAISVTAPAFAASGCTPSADVGLGSSYDWGLSTGGLTTQKLTIGAIGYVDSIPAGLTVVSLSIEWWFANRQGQTSAGPDVFWVGNSTSDKRSSCTSSGCSIPWSNAPAGWNPTVVNTANLQAHTYSKTGLSIPSWNLIETWKASNGGGGTYTTGTNGCLNFTTNDTGGANAFTVTYSGVTALSSTTDPRKVFNTESIVTATLSDGTVLRRVKAVS